MVSNYWSNCHVLFFVVIVLYLKYHFADDWVVNYPFDVQKCHLVLKTLYFE